MKNLGKVMVMAATFLSTYIMAKNTEQGLIVEVVLPGLMLSVALGLCFEWCCSAEKDAEIPIVGDALVEIV
jgi:hypothetical protein